MSADASVPEPVYLSNEYSGPLVEIYAHLHADDGDEAFWLGQAERFASGGRILELGCGSGRLLIPLARAGFTITGVDGSQAMLDALNQKLANEAPEVIERVSLTCAAFDTFTSPEPFDLVFMSCDTFQHLVGTDVQIAALKSMRELLKPKGKLILETSILDVELALLSAEQQQTHEFAAGSDGDIWRMKMIPYVNFKAMRETDLIEIDRIAFDASGAERITERYRSRTEMAIIYPRELELLVRHAGLRITERLGSYFADAFDGDQDQFILIAGR